jgi:SET domain-containing protein
MPYIYPIEVRESVLSGKGLFAAVDIPKGTVYWICNSSDPQLTNPPGIKENRSYTHEELEAVGDHDAIRSIFHGGMYFKCNDTWVAFFDGSEYINHSLSPNSQIVYPESMDYRDLKAITLKDVKAGEEIVEDYSNYCCLDSKWLGSYMQKYKATRLEFEAGLTKEHIAC